ncbi:unnamed protein product [Gongylonema pulchrum]|uniref:Piezo_RRas_bdg domain-containing protein n=1 Tax=Gongylonema pulchrum TaxID=637853 RepID=A0A183EA25_9BILA|nr:unnamed protein product [Gongylonema pulchrum]
MLENFDTFSRQFFLPPKSRVEQSSHPSHEKDDGNNNEKQSLTADRSNHASADKRRSASFNSTNERVANTNGSGSIIWAKSKVACGQFLFVTSAQLRLFYLSLYLLFAPLLFIRFEIELYFSVHKAGDRAEPSNYRPITCVSTCYKLVSSVVDKAGTRTVYSNSP